MSEAPAWRASRLRRVEATAIAAAGYRIVAMLGATLRWRTDGLEHFDAVMRGGRRRGRLERRTGQKGR